MSRDRVAASKLSQQLMAHYNSIRLLPKDPPSLPLLCKVSLGGSNLNRSMEMMNEIVANCKLTISI